MTGMSWLLGDGSPWPTEPDSVAGAAARGAVAGPDGLSLAALPYGPLGLQSPDGSLGRLTVPRGVAVAGRQVLILNETGSLVYRYDVVTEQLVPLPEIGAAGLPPDAPASVYREPRRFRRAANIAALGQALYVADPEHHRVQVFDLDSLALLRIHDGLGDAADVAAGPDAVYILDCARGRVLQEAAGRDGLRVVVDIPSKAHRWSRIAVDRDSRVYLLDTSPTAGDAGPALIALDVVPPGECCPGGGIRERIRDPGEVRGRFERPGVFSEGSSGLLLSGRLADPCGLRLPRDPRTTAWRFGKSVYLLDPVAREIRLSTLDGRRILRFGPRDASGRAVGANDAEAWAPSDMAWSGGCVLILDRRHQVVYAHEPGAPLLRRWFAGPADAPTSWLRLAADADGTLLLWDGGGETVDRVDHNGNSLGSVRYRDVRERFKAADESRLPPPPSRARPVAFPVLHRTGAVTRQDLIAGVAPAPSRVSKGSWLSSWIDSGIYDCQWNLLELSLGELPPGSRITVRTRTANVKPSLAEIAATTTPLEALASWARGAPIVAPSQPSDEELAKAKRQKMLVLSGPGQYLQLLVELAGTGIESPVITSIRIRYPRESYLQYLPAIYSEPEDQRRFLDRYLAIMETSWTELEQLVAGFERYLDPSAVPAGAPMRYLASWLALRLEGTWDEAKNRMLLEAMPRLLSRWGTREGLRAWVRVYLAAMSGLEPEMIERAELPGIEESFVERRRLLLGRGDTATLCAADGLWSPSVERRLQVGVFDRLGDVELVSVGDPELDLFRHYAHGFRVYVPSAWVRGPDEEALLRRAIEAQRPAHTSYELVLVEPRFRVGVQSTVELDTVVGDPVMPPLACPGDDWSRGTLGFDTVLGCGSDRTALGGSDLILA